MNPAQRQALAKYTRCASLACEPVSTYEQRSARRNAVTEALFVMQRLVKLQKGETVDRAMRRVYGPCWDSDPSAHPVDEALQMASDAFALGVRLNGARMGSLIGYSTPAFDLGQSILARLYGPELAEKIREAVSDCMECDARSLERIAAEIREEMAREADRSRVIISSKADLAAYCGRDAVEAVHQAYLDDPDAPEYGRDWSEWLARVVL